MTYTIIKNAQFNSLEIKFDGKPSEAVRNALKALRFRWHSVKKVWYGYSDENTVKAAIDGEKAEPKSNKKTVEKVNKYGVKVGDIFRSTWGYEQTNVDFFQVIELVGACSVRVREVNLPIIEDKATGWASAHRVYAVCRDILPAADFSVHIKDQDKGDLKRLTPTYNGESVRFKMASYADAYLVQTDTVKTYESWYA